jgi:AcrR family transcriptional regulator
MGRHKRISDDDVLRGARAIFRAHGHTATTRQIAEALGISEAVLYQRFGSKDELFFKAMHAIGPDAEELLGPEDPPDDARAYLRGVVARLGSYFAEVIPLALRVMTHPSFDPTSLTRAQAGPPNLLRDALAVRLTSLARRGRLEMRSAPATARLLMSLAHDWALGRALSHARPANGERELRELVDIVWEGLRSRRPHARRVSD